MLQRPSSRPTGNMWLLVRLSRRFTLQCTGTFSTIEHVFLVGVAGGVACFHDDTRHVRRGDVIVSKPAQPGGAIYMQIASRDDDNSLSCLSWDASDPTLSDIAGKLLRKPKTFYKHLDQHVTSGLLHFFHPNYYFITTIRGLLL